MALLPLLLAAGLGASAPGDTTLTILAAASLKQPLERASGEFEKEHAGVKVLVSAAATGVLARQVAAGAPADVLIGAAREPLEGLVQQGLLGPLEIVARNRLVVVVPAGASPTPASLADLAQPRFRKIGLGQPKTVPAGTYAAQALSKAGLEHRLDEKVVYGESVSQVLTYVVTGNVEAGFVYASDAQGAGDKVRLAFPVDDALHEPIVYPAAVVAHSAQHELARAYLDFLLGPKGQAYLQQAGLLAPGSFPDPGRK